MKPSIALLRRAIKNWRSEYTDKSINRANQRAWLKAVSTLGDRWLLAQPINKEV